MSSGVTAAFIDLATFDELEKYSYGGRSAVSYFVREHLKSSWFSQIPTTLAISSGTTDFGNTFEATISRSGDYLLQTWVQVNIPTFNITNMAVAGGDTIAVDPGSGAAAAALSGTGGQLSGCYVGKLGHQLIQEAKITFNDLVAAKLNSEFLDFYYQYYVPASKKVGYANMIGDTAAVANARVATAGTLAIPAVSLYIPLPFFYAQDSGVALPVASLPYNNMKISIQFRPFNQLVNVVGQAASGAICGVQLNNISQFTLAGGAPTVATPPSLNSNVQVWANYAIVSNQERRSMGCTARDILIEQLQTAPRQTVNAATANSLQVDIRFSHSVKALMFCLQNNNAVSQQSNFTTKWLSYQALNNGAPDLSGNNPITTASLIYENTNRLNAMQAGYFAWVNPFYSSRAVTEETGYHLYSYALDLQAVDPCGSTNYSKLSNVSLLMNLSTSATAPVAGVDQRTTAGGAGVIYRSHILAQNKNVIRISGGALGFPVL